MLSEEIYTVEEVAEHLRVPVEVVRKEVAAGRLQAMDVAGFLRFGASDLASYKNAAKAVMRIAGAPPATQKTWLELKAAAEFTHTWPDGTKEHFSNVSEGLAAWNGRSYHVKLGFTTRIAAGQPRRRCLVIIDRYPTVEFVAADNKPDTRLLASVIKDRTGKQIPANATAPAEYQGLSVGSYREVVDGPNASNGLAVVCEANDFETIVKHALIRYRYREERD